MQATAARLGVTDYAQKILDVLKDSDPFMAGKALECAKILYDCHIREEDSDRIEKELRTLGG